jgi:hypothetical protein
VEGSKATLTRGTAVTAQSAADCPPYWFSGDSTIILGAGQILSEQAASDTLATWYIPTAIPTAHHFKRGHLVVACLRYFGGLHSYQKDSRIDVFVNDNLIDGFALRIIPPDHSDYFHRIPVPVLPNVSPLAGCQTVYAWPLRKYLLAFGIFQKIAIRIDKGVRWDVDYVGLLLESQKTRPRIFLSYSTKDRQIADELVQALSNREIGVWMDQAEIAIGDRLTENIKRAIDAVDYVVVLFSENALESAWVMRELEIAMDYERENNCVKVLPIIIDQSKLPEVLFDRLHSRLTTPSELDIAVTLIEDRLR